MFTCLASITEFNSTILYVNNKSNFLYTLLFQKYFKREFNDKKIHFYPFDLFFFLTRICVIYIYLLSLKFTLIFEVRIAGGRNTYLEHRHVADCFSYWILYAS